MKIACRVGEAKGLIVGYASVKGGKVKAIVLTQGELRAIKLQDIILVNVPEDLEKVVPLKAKAKG